MSDKTLLNEATIRRFMKLAEMAPLTNDFVKEMYADQPAYQDDEGDEALEAPVEDEFAAEEEVVEPEAEELDVELDMEEEPAEEAEEEVDAEGELTLTDEEAEVFLKVADKVRAAMEAEPAAEELPVPDMGDEDLEADVELPAEEPAMDEEPPAEEEAEELETEEEDLVQEIARRVAKRLLTKKED